MIVVDTNVLAYWYITSPKYSNAARDLMEIDPDWNAPFLWRSEFRNILLKYLRAGMLTLTEASQIQADAEDLMRDCEFHMDSDRVLELAKQSGCSAYDCEFIALAERLGAKLVTADAALLKAFPETAVSLI